MTESEKAKRRVRAKIRARKAIQAAAAKKKEPDFPLMGQLNAGIADSVGGLVDFVNPLTEQTGSARDGLVYAMQQMGIAVNDAPPDGIMEGMFRGAGGALGASVPVAKGVQVAAQAPNAIGRFASQIAPSLSTTAAPALEALGGATSGGAKQSVKEAGGPEWAQESAAVLAALSVPAVTGTLGQVGKVSPVLATIRSVRSNLAPFTEAGGRDIARKRVRSMVGGNSQADEAAKLIDSNNNPANLTPAEQIGDPNLLALQQRAMAEDPNLRNFVNEQAEAGMGNVVREMRDFGDPDDMIAFYATRREEFKSRIGQMIDNQLARAEREIDVMGPSRSEAENSFQVARRIDQAYDEAKVLEKQLWDAVPEQINVKTSNTMEAAQEVRKRAGKWGKRTQLPSEVWDLLKSNNIGDVEDADDLMNLYSILRREARVARGLQTPNEALAGNADLVADAILRDLDASDSLSAPYAAARAFTRELHETFDRGAVGKLTRKLKTGERAIPPEKTLDETVWANNDRGLSAGQIGTATKGTSDPFVEDYIRGRFSDAIRDVDGQFTRKKALTFMRDNKELMESFPGLKGEIEQAVKRRDSVEQTMNRLSQKMSQVDKLPQSQNKAQKVVDGIYRADNPGKAALSALRTAKKDRTGKAVGGLKSAFADDIIQRATSETGNISGRKLVYSIAGDASSVINRLFSKGELERLAFITGEVAKREIRPADAVDSMSGVKPLRILDIIVRRQATRAATGGSGNMAVGMQDAQMASSAARDLLQKLTRNRADAILRDAVVKDPELMKALLTEIDSETAVKKAISRMLPYLVGASSETMAGE